MRSSNSLRPQRTCHVSHHNGLGSRSTGDLVRIYFQQRVAGAVEHRRRKRLNIFWLAVRPSTVDDTKIKAGATWRAEIDDALKSAKAAVLLVSPDFLALDFIAENELPQLLAAAESKDLKSLWVYISPCFYKEIKLGEHQAAHDIS